MIDCVYSPFLIGADINVTHIGISQSVESGLITPYLALRKSRGLSWSWLRYSIDVYFLGSVLHVWLTIEDFECRGSWADTEQHAAWMLPCFSYFVPCNKKERIGDWEVSRNTRAGRLLISLLQIEVLVRVLLRSVHMKSRDVTE